MNRVPTLKANVRLYASQEKTDLLGFADLEIGGAFVIKGITIRMGKASEKGPAGPYLSFPAKKGAKDQWYEIAHPISAEGRKEAIAVVLAAYQSALGTPA